jgi:hypothetical protein
MSQSGGGGGGRGDGVRIGRVSPGDPGKPKFLRVAVVIFHRLYAVQARDTLARDELA